MNEPRRYRDDRDLEAMLQVLMEGRKADNGSYYVHIGDLKWWLYYPPLESDLWNHIYLWDDPDQEGRLLGWALISPDWVGFDVYIQPELRGSDYARDMYVWAEAQAIEIARKKELKTIYCLWVRHDDRVLAEHLTSRGFHLRRGMIHLTRTWAEDLPPVELPDGFSLRSSNGLPDVKARSMVQYGAFNSSAPFERYLERFANFMRSPVYQSELDIVAVASDGRIGAFCIVWIDPVNQVGLYEPVGTHPDFQRKGLGRAVMMEGLRRLQERGAKSAIVSTYEDNLAGIKLYEAAGFQQVHRLGTYEKDY
ncbi:MAG TPA: GNAT family N-acetyltransferase [Anaerolineales bacterium]|nr:GNAT family N-acetyltransferase [Anaerolineales bacterium]